jgi:aryl-alcohol dehydrogenase-like predicted oxidoreductase
MAGRPEGDAEYARPLNHRRREHIRDLAIPLECTPTQVALAWLMHQPFPVVPITGTNDLVHLTEVMGATSVSLGDAQVAWLAG